MENSISKYINSGSNLDQESLDALIPLLSTVYPSEDLNDVSNLKRLLKKEFELDFTEADILNHYVVKMEEEDIKLQQKHLNLHY